VLLAVCVLTLIAQFLMQCNKNIALHKYAISARFAPTGRAQKSGGTAVFSAGFLAQSFWQHVCSIPGLLGGRGDLGPHIPNAAPSSGSLACQLLHKLERRRDVPLSDPTASSPTPWRQLRVSRLIFTVLTACCAAEIKISNACLACSTLFLPIRISAGTSKRVLVSSLS
jgi:hypothetical protein